MSEERPRPAWLIGLVIAVLLFALVLVALNALGFGDDPSLGSQAVGGGILLPLQSIPSAGR